MPLSSVAPKASFDRPEMRSRPHSRAGWRLLAALLAFAFWTAFAGLIAQPALALPAAAADAAGDFACADLDGSQRCARICSSAHPAAATLGERPLRTPVASGPIPHVGLSSAQARGPALVERPRAGPSPPLYLRFLTLLL